MINLVPICGVCNFGHDIESYIILLVLCVLCRVYELKVYCMFCTYNLCGHTCCRKCCDKWSEKNDT